MTDERRTGTVAWYDTGKGFGFLTPDDGDLGGDVFVHFRALAEGHRGLVEGDRVSFAVREGDRGLQAAEVEVDESAPRQEVDVAGPSAHGRLLGTVSWFDADKGFGFLTPDDGSADVFVHFSEIATDGFRTLDPDERVEFGVKDSDRGPQAQDVVVLRADAGSYGDRRDDRTGDGSGASALGEGGDVLVSGTLTWLNADKGYGFITPDDLFVHVSQLHGMLDEGARVSFVVRHGPRGAQAEQVGAAPSAVARSAPQRTASGRVRGTVNWFDTTKGFGFLTPADGSADVFVHASQAGGAQLLEGDEVEFGVRQGDRGPQAEDVRLLA